jgi:hypothetical protein
VGLAHGAGDPGEGEGQLGDDRGIIGGGQSLGLGRQGPGDLHADLGQLLELAQLLRPGVVGLVLEGCDMGMEGSVGAIIYVTKQD